MGPDRIGGEGVAGLGGLNVSGVSKENLEAWLFAVETQISNVMKERGIKLQTLQNYDVGSSQEQFLSAATKNQTGGITPDIAEADAEAKLKAIHAKEMQILEARINKVKAAEADGELSKADEFTLGQKILQREMELKLLKAGNNERLKEKINAEYNLKLAELKVDTLQEMEEVYKEIGVSIKDGLVEGINAAIDGTKTLGEIASNVFRQISNQLISYGINASLGSIPGLEKIFGRASGGPVKGGSPYIDGEKGPELFVPGSSGNIVPNHAMGGTNVVVNVDASGSSVQGDGGQAEELGSMLAAAVQAEIANQQRPGGLLAGTR